MLHMLRGTRTVIYLSDLMKRVGAVDASYRVIDGQTTVRFVLPDGQVKNQTLPRSAKLINDKKEGMKDGLAD
jgi:hypothetical protein